MEPYHTHHPVQSTRQLMAVHLTELGNPDRQLTVRVQAVFENQYMPGAVHRFQRESRFVNFCKVHIFMVMVPVT